MAQVFVDYVLLDSSGDRDREAEVIRKTLGAHQTISDIAGVVKQTAGAPDWGKESGVKVILGYARVFVLSGAVLASWGQADPDPTIHPAARLDQGQTRMFPLREGQTIGFIEAAEAPPALSLPAGMATSAAQVALNGLVGEVQPDPTANTVLARLKALLTGIVLAAGSAIIGKVGIDQTTPGTTNAVVASPSAAQDPILDHANGEKETVSTSAVVFTPPAGCYFAHFDANVETFIRTDNAPAADAAGARRLIADQGEILPVTPGVDVRAYCATSAVLRIIPMKVRA